MTESRKPMPSDFSDEVPDLSASDWQATFAEAKVNAGGHGPRLPR